MHKKVIKILSYLTVCLIVPLGMLFASCPDNIDSSEGDVIITEFFFQKSSGILPEYIEFFNTTTQSICLDGWTVEIDGNEYPINDQVEIPSKSYFILLSKNGTFRDSGGSTYCSAFNFQYPFNTCSDSTRTMYWFLETFLDLNNSSGTIRIWENIVNDNKSIDEVIYNNSNSFPVGSNIRGQSAEYILDPLTYNSYLLNDLGNNWRSSQHEDDWLTSGLTKQKGSPLKPNFITPSIMIAPNPISESICLSNIDSVICQPKSDGYPGGYVDLQFSGYAINSNDAAIDLDSLYWEITKNNNNIQSMIDTDDFIVQPNPISQDTSLEYTIYQVDLLSRGMELINRYLGKTDTTLYIKRESNVAPEIVHINNQPDDGIINIFEDSLNFVLKAHINDIEIGCGIGSLNSCVENDLFHPNKYFGRSNSTNGAYDSYNDNSPFFWSALNSSDINKLENNYSREVGFTPEAIDSLGSISANDNPKEYKFTFKATDPFGYSDFNTISVKVHNKNKKPSFSLEMTNISTIDIIAGYSFKLVVVDNLIELQEYDASGDLLRDSEGNLEKSIIGSITDDDNDKFFNVYPRGLPCENVNWDSTNYCIKENVVKTKPNSSYEKLIIPIVVDDRVPSAINTYISDSLSISKDLIINNINHLRYETIFSAPIEKDIYNNFHIPEDTSDVIFKINFSLDSISNHFLNVRDLKWSVVNWTDWQNANQQVSVIKKFDPNQNISNVEFKIDSLFANYNGYTVVKIQLLDLNKTATTISDFTIDVPIYIDQRNDSPIIHPFEVSYSLQEDDYDIPFNLQFSDIDSDSSLNDIPFNLNNLNWIFQNLNDIDNQRIFINQTNNGLIIDSLSVNYNGEVNLNVIVTDDGSLSDTLIVPIYIEAKNDPPTINIVDDVLIDSVNFANNYYFLPEDTSNVRLNIEFNDVDSDTVLNQNSFNIKSLNWEFLKLDNELEQKIFPLKTEEGLIINSVLPDYNGPTGFRAIITDDAGTTDSLTVFIYLEQRNDIAQPFDLHLNMNEYAIDPTTINRVRNDLYFRLPQYKINNNNYWESDTTIKKIRFQWNKTIDIDNDPEKNMDILYETFYQLQFIDKESSEIIHLTDMFILDDCVEGCVKSLPNDVNSICGIEGEIVCVDIDILSYSSLNISGEKLYKWRVVTQNLSNDNLNNDPYQVSNGWDSSNFRIDFLPPVITEFNIMMNQIYLGYYDIIWQSNGAFLTDSTFITIIEDYNQIGTISQINPRRISDKMYHITSYLPENIKTASISYDLQLRDKAMNIGSRTDKVSYVMISNDSLSFESSSGLASFFINENGVQEPIGIFINEQKINKKADRNTSEIYQLTPLINFSPKEIILNNKGKIKFDINNYLSSDIYYWQYIIVKLTDNGYEELTTFYYDGIVSANITDLSSYSVFVNTNISMPTPSSFKLLSNYPNPFNPTTIIPLEVPKEAFIKVQIINILGQEVITLLNGIEKSGYKNLQWNGDNHFGQQVGSGIYFVKVQYENKYFINKMMLLK